MEKVPLPDLIRLEGEALICGSCRRQWKAPQEMSDDNLGYLWDHVDGHKPIRRKQAGGATGWFSERKTGWRTPIMDPVQCQTCLTWFNTRRCLRCYPNYDLARTR
jgi:hypothetical protein